MPCTGSTPVHGIASSPAVAVRNLGGEEINGYRNAVGIAVGDVHADGIVDIVVANESGSNVGLHAGLGDGAFEQRQIRYGMRPRVTDVELADLTGDGVLDVIRAWPSCPVAGSPTRRTRARPAQTPARRPRSTRRHRRRKPLARPAG